MNSRHPCTIRLAPRFPNRFPGLEDRFVVPAQERDALNGRRLLLLGLKLTVSVLLIWYLLGTHDLGAVGRHLGGISARSVALALIVLSAEMPS